MSRIDDLKGHVDETGLWGEVLTIEGAAVILRVSRNEV